METKQKKILLIGAGSLVGVLIAVIVVLVVLLMGKKNPAEELGGAEGANTYVIEEGNYQQIMDEMQSQVEEGYFETYMTTEWVFPDGESEATEALLGNSPVNTKPIRCEVLLRDTGEKVFSTGVIPIGAELPSIKLDVDLDAGTYPAMCVVYLLEEAGDGTYKDYSNAGFSMTIVVEK